jgi:monovalent cation:H+ antiporter, CPA1 family
MLMSAIELMGLVIFASILQKNYKIPSPVTLMAAVLGCMAFNYPLFQLDATQFDNLVLFTLPLLIATDALKLKFNDLKAHGVSLFWVAVISVLVSIVVGVLVNNFILVSYPLSVAAIVILFCMVSATDPITVSAIFSNFHVPHKLKVLTEGESLFNDATALIVFSIALIALNHPEEVTFGFIAMKSFAVVFGALAIGVALGYLTTIALKLSDDAFIEATIILFSAYLSYMVAEHFHFSGILAVIVNMVIANRVIQKIIDTENVEIEEAKVSKNIGLLKYAMTTKDNQVTILKSIDFVALFASSMLFVSIASIANFEKLWQYRYEIIAIFIASTIIRALMMLKFAVVSNQISFMQSIYKHWWAVLTFAGSKGALSILMVHLLPATFVYKELFENIIIGNVFLSTFIYALVLAGIIMKNKARFEVECAEEQHH